MHPLPYRASPVPRSCANGPNEDGIWEISYLCTSERGIWLYLYLAIDVTSRTVMAWDLITVFTLNLMQISLVKLTRVGKLEKFEISN